MSPAHGTTIVMIAVSLLSGLAAPRAVAGKFDFASGRPHTVAMRSQPQRTIQGRGAGVSAVVERSALPMKSDPPRSSIRKILFGFEPTGYDTNPFVTAWKAGKGVPLYFGSQLPEAQHSALSHVARSIKKAIPGSKIPKNKDILVHQSEMVRTPAGDRYRVHFDPEVIEAATPPVQLRDVRKTLSPLYAAFQKAGVQPRPGTQGGGHIHVDKTPFMKDPLLLRNLLVDSYNFGILKLVMRPFDMTSSSSTWNLGEDKEFRAAIRKMDLAAKKTGKYEWQTVLKVMKPFYVDKKRPVTRKRDVNLRNLYRADGSTVEFRAFEAQAGSQESYLQAQLLQRYLEGLSAVKQPVPVADQRSIDQWYKSVDAKGQFNYALVEKKWQGFIQQLGLDYKDYRPFMERWNLKAAKPAQPDPKKNIQAFFEHQMR